MQNSNIFTEYDQSRKKDLLEKYPNLIEIEEKIINKIKNNEDFILNIGSNWEFRQFGHIVASENGWFSKKIMRDNFRFGTGDAKCNKCRWILVEPKGWENDYAYCCNVCQGVCPNKCQKWYPYSNGSVWIGDIMFSNKSLKQGRKTRSRRNRWKKGMINKS